MKEVVTSSIHIGTNIYVHVITVGGILFKSCVVRANACIFMSSLYVLEQEALIESLDTVANMRLNETSRYQK